MVKLLKQYLLDLHVVHKVYNLKFELNGILEISFCIVDTNVQGHVSVYADMPHLMYIWGCEA